MRVAAVVPLLALALAMPASAADPDLAKARGEKVVCKGERTLEFGSHRRAKKVCKTEAEWALLEKNTQRELQSFRDRAQTHGDKGAR